MGRIELVKFLIQGMLMFQRWL